MKRFRAVILSIEAAALVGIVMFSVAGGMRTREPIYLALQFLCGLLIVAGELAVRHIDGHRDDSAAKHAKNR